ncbi:MAG: protein-export membrane protein SecF, partial [Candidatus Nealsonbacteria bacterium RIFCSPHIGHO2_12_FULL_38_18]
MHIRYTKYRLIYFIFSAVLLSVCLAMIFIFGLKQGIDFTGGSILEIEYKDSRPSNEEIANKLTGLDLGLSSIQLSREKGVILRMKDINEGLHNEVISQLSEENNGVTETRFELIGPTIGRELRTKTIILILLALLAMVIYISLAFRRVQRPLGSWYYGLASILCLFHDIIFPLGVFAVLGKFLGVDISISIITALLTVLGSSINNTVVVFDRIRENLYLAKSSFEEIVDMSLNQTLSRQINTSLTALLGLTAIFIFGGETLKYFSLVLILGIIAGTYSSFFIAGPVLVALDKWRRNK